MARLERSDGRGSLNGSFVGQALGLPIPGASRIRSRRDVGQGWHRRRQTTACRKAQDSISTDRTLDVERTPIPEPPRSCGFATQTSSMSGPPTFLWPEVSTRGSLRTLLPHGTTIFSTRTGHALHSLTLHSGSCHPEVFCRACSWHAFLPDQCDAGNPDQQAAQD